MSDHCEQRYLTSGSSVNQRGTQNYEKKPFECDVCEKTFNRSDYLAVHKRTHTGDKPYECDACKKKFAQSGNLATHKRIHTGQYGMLYFCAPHTLVSRYDCAPKKGCHVHLKMYRF